MCVSSSPRLAAVLVLIRTVPALAEPLPGGRAHRAADNGGPSGPAGHRPPVDAPANDADLDGDPLARALSGRGLVHVHHLRRPRWDCDELDPVAFAKLVEQERVLDGRNALVRDTWEAAGSSYRALGRRLTRTTGR